MDAGNEATLTLPSDREIVIARTFAARKATVFTAWTKAEHLRRWLTCPTMSMPVCELDFREGGTWRRVLRDPAHGVDHPTSGVFREIVPFDRIVFTERYEPIPESEHLVTLTFEERGGLTLFTQRILHDSREGRDAHLRSGMERGLRETLGRLEELLRSLASEEREATP